MIETLETDLIISRDIAKSSILALPDSRRDDINLIEAKPNPQILRESESIKIQDVYLSEGDLKVLENYSQSYTEPPMGYHNRWECPHCIEIDRE